MRYTFRTAHLKERPPLEIGDKVLPLQFIGIMGSTGKSTGPHNHSDNVEGWQKDCYRQSDMAPNGRLISCPERLLYAFEDNMFYGRPVRVTAFYLDLNYWIKWKKQHYGFDTSVYDKKQDEEIKCYWPFSYPGTVLANTYDRGYGNYINIGYEVPL